MRGLRRAVLAMALGVLVSLVVRLRGDGTTPVAGGGWRELQGPDLR